MAGAGARPFPEQGLWIGDVTAVEHEMVALMAIWDSMPLHLKEQCLHDGAVNALMLGEAMHYCWHEEIGPG